MPFTPEKFKFKLKKNQGILDQFKILKDLRKRPDV